MAKRVKLTALAMACGLAVTGSVVKADTLADAMIGAYNTSGLLEQNRAVLRAADEDVAQAMAALRPVISWSADATRQFGTSRSESTRNTIVPTVSNSVSASLVAELTVFDSGQNKFALETAKEAVLGTRQQLINVEQQVLLSAVEAHLEVRRAIENVALRENNVRLIRQELNAAQQRFEVGEVTRTDTSLAEARLAAARSQLAAAEGSLTVAREQYLAIVGRLPNNLQPVQSLPNLPDSVDAAKAIAVRAHPQIKSVQHRISASELGILRAKAAMNPSVRLAGRLTVTEGVDSDRFSRGGSVGVEAGGPIYQGGRLTSLVRQAMANRDQARGELHQAIDQVSQNVGNAYAQLRIAAASLESTERQVRAATVAFRGVREEAELGARTTLDVLNAEQELLNARSARISAKVDQDLAAYRVLSTLGRLTASDLRLNVQQYDPISYYNLVKDSPIQKSEQGQKLDRVLQSLGKN